MTTSGARALTNQPIVETEYNLQMAQFVAQSLLGNTRKQNIQKVVLGETPPECRPSGDHLPAEGATVFSWRLARVYWIKQSPR